MNGSDMVQVPSAIGQLTRSYLRLISDTAPGIVVIATLVALYPGAIIERFGAFGIFAAILAILLATPVGLLLNSLSWFVLGWSEPPLERYFRDHPRHFLARGTHGVNLVDRAHAELGGGDWIELTRTIAAYARSKRPEMLIYYEHVLGLHRFSRSLALIVPPFTLIGVWGAPLHIIALGMALSVVVAFGLLILSSLAYFFYMSGLLVDAWALARTQGDFRMFDPDLKARLEKEAAARSVLPRQLEVSGGSAIEPKPEPAQGPWDGANGPPTR